MPATLSYATATVLHAIQNGRRYGFEIMEATGMPSGTVYPALRKLEQAGLIHAQWERESQARAEHRPARRYYQVTTAGEAALAAAGTRYRFPEVSKA
ncbi:MAG TPA: helix-turn-helix transcriptional regulator [Bryobacteraceae bacterium]|nr:helix-turn-helix transcriptional regulator [Bryobacteraceae bacterium]